MNIACFRLPIALMLLMFLPGCWQREAPQAAGRKHTFFLQLPLENKIIKNLQRDLKPKIDRMIERVIGMKQPRKNFPMFICKKRQAITGYYFLDLFDNWQSLSGIMSLFVEPTLDELRVPVPRRVSMAPEFDFFGEYKPGLFGHIELVMMIDDPAAELSAMNHKLKASSHQANAEYCRVYGIDLYDIAKSERFPYKPHLALGALRVNYIKYLVNDSARESKIIEEIKQKIKAMAAQYLSQFDKRELLLDFTEVAIYSVRKQKYVHKVKLL